MANSNVPGGSQTPIRGKVWLALICMFLCILPTVLTFVFNVSLFWKWMSGGFSTLGTLSSIVGAIFEPAQLQKFIAHVFSFIGNKIVDKVYEYIKGRIWLSISVLFNIILVLIIAYPWVHSLSIFQPVRSFVSPLSCDICEQTIDGQAIGISDGRYIFDMRSNIQNSSDSVPNGSDKDVSEKKQGAALMPANPSAAANYFAQAVQDDASDGEALIYYQNAQLLASHPQLPLAVVVVPTSLAESSSTTGPGQAALSVAQADLQGIALVQEKINVTSGRDCLIPVQGDCLKLFVMIANIGTSSSGEVYTDQVTQQIIRLNQDKHYHLLGVVGWPKSTNNTIIAIRTLGAAGILNISPTASSDALTDNTPYFFRVAPPDREQGAGAADYAELELHVKHVVIFFDQSNPYSWSLASGFYDEFAKNGQNTITLEPYKRGQPASLPQDAQTAYQHDTQLQMIFFAGDSDDFDWLRTTLLDNEQNYPWATRVFMMGGDALANTGGYEKGYKKFFLTAFTYPGTWSSLGESDPTAFDTDYSKSFGVTWSHMGNPYGYIRASTGSVLSYDAMETLVNAIVRAYGQLASGSAQQLTMSDIQQALFIPAPSNDFQGAGGRIRYSLSGDPIDKAFEVLCVDANGLTHLSAIEGDFLQGSTASGPHIFSPTCF